MEEVGRLLRQAREDLGLTLAEVEARTKIRSRYLEALEEGQHDVLPGKVYALGFLRNYARFLGMDAELVVSQIKDSIADDDVIKVSEDHLPAYDRRPKRVFLGKGLFKAVIGVLVALLILSGIYNLWPSRKGNGEIDPTIAEEQGPEVKIEDQEIDPPAILPEAEEKQEVVINVEDEQGARCWVEVLADGEKVFTGTLERAEKKVFIAQEKIKITLGDAGAVRVTYNGQELGTPGKKGEVVPMEFPRE
ncbi:MAG TPA: helix-turn-helix domain-containing protein [Clostridia bacterium]|nr:helix-turn-helix domain-containing protein [Clostridia bacterium]